ncbi:MAG: hypothetical protein A2Y63_05380 [Candidatus Riflebacteria bacterium RBG_13_59_9]|nr:MAG: hypothetical protein A2Y63_05380 [Candidatus Riflebacteria bacterium RBG_13_59_9]
MVRAWERYLLYSLIALAVLLPLMFPFDVWPNLPTKEVKGVFDTIDNLQPGDTILVAVDFDPSSEPELYPMLLAVLRHAFGKDIYVIGINLFGPAGTGLGVKALSDVGEETGKVDGEDYVMLGFKPNLPGVISQINSDIKEMYRSDANGRSTADMPILQRTPKLQGNIKYMVDLAAGETVRPWVAFGSAPGGYPMGAGCTAVSFADYFSFYQSGQINGLMGGLKAAAEYEELIGQKGAASAGMNSQSIVHVLLVLFVIVGNFVFFRALLRKRAEARGRA